MTGDVRGLAVFRRAYALSLVLHQASQSFPKTEQYGGLADQLRRASKSVCALLIEGRARQLGSDIEFRRYVIMAMGSTDEARLWCEYARDLGYIEAAAADAWMSELSEIARMLQGMMKHLSSLTPDS